MAPWLPHKRPSVLTVVLMRGVPWWGVVSSAAAPVLLTGGWVIAASMQPQPYDAIRQSVSALAGAAAADRWVMTLAFVVVAVCDISTGLALRPAAFPGRLILVAGGLTGVLVAASPESLPGSFSLAHALWAALGFTFLAAWPLAARRAGPGVPWGLRPVVTIGAATVIVVLLAWFLAELATGGPRLGLAERVLGSAQVIWPLLVVLSCLQSGRSASIDGGLDRAGLDRAGLDRAGLDRHGRGAASDSGAGEPLGGEPRDTAS